MLNSPLAVVYFRAKLTLAARTSEECPLPQLSTVHDRCSEVKGAVADCCCGLTRSKGDGRSKEDCSPLNCKCV